LTRKHSSRVVFRFCLRERRESGLVIEGGAAIGVTTCPTAATTTATGSALASVTATSTTTARRTIKADLDLEEDLFLLFGACLWSRLCLSGKVCLAFAFIQTGCAIEDSFFCAFVGLAGLELWKESVLLFFLLCEVLVESKGVVFFFWISVCPASAVCFVGAGGLSWGRILRGSAPVAGGGICCGSSPVVGGSFCGSTPVVAGGLGSGVDCCGFFSL
jgi:hypothetical protein